MIMHTLQDFSGYEQASKLQKSIYTLAIIMQCVCNTHHINIVGVCNLNLQVYIPV